MILWIFRKIFMINKIPGSRNDPGIILVDLPGFEPGSRSNAQETHSQAYSVIRHGQTLVRFFFLSDLMLGLGYSLVLAKFP